MEQLTLLTNNLYKQLREDIRQSSTIYMLTSFLMKSGVDIIFDDLKTALLNGADVKILTGDYLYVTQPHALLKLLTLPKDNLEIRLWRSNGISFHPKSFIFKHREHGAFIVGSSNLSRSALTTGVEWNLRMERQVSKNTFDQAMQQFIQLFYADETIEINQESIKKYDNDYHQFHAKNANLLQTWTEKEEIELTLPTERVQDTTVSEETPTYDIEITPRPAQQEALQALQATMEEDYDKAMVVMATGLGKTYLAAFFAK